MARENKIFDRQPIICPAGKRSAKNEHVKELLKDYSTNEYAEHLIIDQESKQINRNVIYTERPMFEEGAKKCFDQTLKSRFKTFESKLMESLFYKNHPLGVARPANSKPDHVTNEDYTFGRPIVKSEKLYDLILPPKKYEDVLRESQRGHLNYIRSHGDYNPSEQVNRNYNPSTYNPKQTFGQRNNVDVLGGNVKRIMSSCFLPANVCFLPVLQAQVASRSKAPLGSCKKGVLPDLPPDHVFGFPYKPDMYAGKRLLYNRTFSHQKVAFYEALAHINLIRRYLKKHSHLEEVRIELDESETPTICSWEHLYAQLTSHYIPISATKSKLIATHYKIMDSENNVNWRQFLNLLNIYVPLPEIGAMEMIITPTGDKRTTYQVLTSSLFGDDKNCEAVPAGINLRQYCQLPPEYCSSAYDSLPDETDVKALLSPSIPSQYGLSHRDYLIPRTMTEIRDLFARARFGLEDSEIQTYWDKAKKEWTSEGDKVSIEAFLHALKESKKQENRK